MGERVEIEVPDIGDFAEVEVIEVLVAVGDSVAVEDPLITLESDKASMEIPSPVAGVVRAMKVEVGARVSAGTVVASVETESREEVPPLATPDNTPSPAPSPGKKPAAVGGEADLRAELVVIGAGPGGYTAAFRAADLGLETLLIERYPTLGGVCLNVGCIPSKALLHAAKVIAEADEFAAHGIRWGQPEIDLDRLRHWKDSVVGKLTGGLAALAGKRKVKVVRGTARFGDANHVLVAGADGGEQRVAFKQCIIATGSEPVKLPFIPDHPAVLDSTGALALTEIPASMLVIGGGIIGLEMATVYHALGTEISVVELLPELIAGADSDIVRPLHKRIKSRYQNIMLQTRVTAVTPRDQGLEVTFEGKNAPDGARYFDRVLVAVGRTPNGHSLDCAAAGVAVDEQGFIAVDAQQRTNVAGIFALGDVVGQPMLAHKAVHEGRVAAEVCAGRKSFFDARVIPSVAYTDPEVAWVGMTEMQAQEQGIKYGKGVFPWAASGRSLSLGRDEGMTKLLFDDATGKVIGGGIVGPQAGDLIAEVALAIETNCDAADIGLTIHPHPTLSETIAMSAEAFEGTITDLYLPKRKKR